MTEALIADAAAASGAWGQLASVPELVHQRENAIFRIIFDDGRRCALRLHRPGYQSAASVEAELRLMESLADAGFACPWPQRSGSGGLVETSRGQLVSVVQWIDGATIAAATGSEGLNVAERQEVYRRLGGLIADLHLTADAVAPAGFRRQDWRPDAICGDAPRWGRFWENPALSAPEADLLRVASATARVRLQDLPPDQSGVIHADLLQENVLEANGTMYLIDFDDCGIGPRLYDLGTALIQHVEGPIYSELRGALVAGYRAGGGPLPDTAYADLELFVMLRALASAGWIVSRAAADDPRQRTYAARAVACARAFIDR